MRLFRVCPHCGVKCEFDVLTNYDGSRSRVGCPNPGYYVIARCRNCEGFVFGEVKNLYPKSVFRVQDKILREPILSDYNEVLKCFEVDAFKATAVMCRRVLQFSVEEKGGEGKDLLEKINDLDHKRIITRAIRDWTHQIRMFGRYGAHPVEGNLDFVDKKQAEICLEFLKNYLHYVYEMPHQLAQSQKKFEEVKQKKGHK